MPVTATIITEFDDKLLTEWHDLWQRSFTRSVFLHPGFQQAWWQHESSGQLQLIAISNDNHKLIGLVPLFQKSNILRLVGAKDLSDYLDMLVDQPYQGDVYSAVIDQLSEMPWSELRLESLSQHSPILTIFADELRNQEWSVTQSQQDVCPVIILHKTWHEYLASLASDQHKKFVRLLRTIGEEDEITFRLIEKPEEMKTAISSFIDLHKSSSSEKAQFWSTSRENFFQEMAFALSQDNLVKLYFLDVNGDPAASIFLFDYLNQFLAYNSGFNAYRYGHLGVSNALLLYTIRQAIELGRSRYDFMRGDEPYKYLFGAQTEVVFDLTIQR